MSCDEIEAEAKRRGISRLAHFTPLRNLVHIATGVGLVSTRELEQARADFNPQDLERLDGYPDHISCGVQYPNAYYVRRKRRGALGEDRLFPDWVCLLIEPRHLWRDDTLFCRHNAAGASGANVAEGADVFRSMFADRVESPQQTWERGNHPPSCPTDAQAEVLVHREIPLEDVMAVAVGSAEQAGNTYAILRQLRAPVDDLPFVIAPAFYEPTSLASAIASGRRPDETPWHAPSNGGER